MWGYVATCRYDKPYPASHVRPNSRTGTEQSPINDPGRSHHPGKVGRCSAAQFFCGCILPPDSPGQVCQLSALPSDRPTAAQSSYFIYSFSRHYHWCPYVAKLLLFNELRETRLKKTVEDTTSTNTISCICHNLLLKHSTWCFFFIPFRLRLPQNLLE